MEAVATSPAYTRNLVAQNKPRTLEQFAPLINKLAQMGARRAEAAGIPLEFEDLQQELCIHFLDVRAKYRDDGGRSFMNYFIHGARHRFSQLFRPFERKLKFGVTVSGDQVRLEDSSTLSGWEVIEDPSAKPDQILEGDSMVQFIADRLSPLAAELFALIVNPPEDIYDQLESADRGITLNRNSDQRSISVRAQRYHEIGPQFLGDLLGLPTSITRRCRDEIHNAVAAYYAGSHD